MALHYNSSVDAAEAVAKDIADAGGDVFLVRGDVTVTANTMRIVEESASHFGGLDGLINNAGLMVDRVLLCRHDRRALRQGHGPQRAARW